MKETSFIRVVHAYRPIGLGINLLTIGHQASSPSNGHQGDISYSPDVLYVRQQFQYLHQASFTFFININILDMSNLCTARSVQVYCNVSQNILDWYGFLKFLYGK